MLINQNTSRVFDYWKSKRQNGDIPHRRDIEPSALGRALGSVCLLRQTDRDAAYRFALAGSRLGLILGRELTGDLGASLFHRDSCHLSQQAFSVIAEEAVGVVLELTGTSARDRELRFEAVMLPLTSTDGQTIIMAAIEPHEVTAWLGSDAVVSMRIDTLRVINIEEELFAIRSRPAVPIPFRSHHHRDLNRQLRVIDGNNGVGPRSNRDVQLQVIECGMQ
ncbi:MAG: PAS domain-containing protein [Pseudomonadota bacterium]